MNQTRKNLNLNFCDHDMNYECVKKFENWSFFFYRLPIFNKAFA